VHEVLDLLARFGTNEVILVIGDEKLARHPDVVFVNPRDTPSNLLSWEYLDLCRNIFSGDWEYEDMTWDLLVDYYVNGVSKNFQDILRRRNKWINGMPSDLLPISIFTLVISKYFPAQFQLCYGIYNN
jgi:hypothetical protein